MALTYNTIFRIFYAPHAPSKQRWFSIPFKNSFIGKIIIIIIIILITLAPKSMQNIEIYENLINCTSNIDGISIHNNTQNCCRLQVSLRRILFKVPSTEITFRTNFKGPKVCIFYKNDSNI